MNSYSSSTLLNRTLCGIWVVALLCLGAFLPASTLTAAGSKGPIDELHLFSLPTALNLDQKPGPDGFEIRIYGSTGEKAKGVTIGSGSVEIIMFDGVVSAGDATGKVKALRVWTFGPNELRRNAAKSALGIGYRMLLKWEEAAPKRESITVIARFIASKGADPIYSTPCTIAVSSK